jgi:gamma-glutamylcyclotransferase (GGCT)/AIG2-like uncharacterized protein YtfP
MHLMHELQRYRSGKVGIAEAAHSFVQAIEDTVDVPKGERRRVAALVYRLDLQILDKLDGLRQHSERRTDPLNADGDSSIAQRTVQKILPEVIRQIARIEAGYTVAVLYANIENVAVESSEGTRASFLRTPIRSALKAFVLYLGWTANLALSLAQYTPNFA